MILIPVKNLNTAKQRLSAVLDQRQRTQLAQTMLQDVLDAVSQLGALCPVALVTSDPFATELATGHGFEVIPDLENPGETEAVAMSTELCRARGVEFTLVLPGDIPLVTAEEISAVIHAAPAQGSVLVPAADGRGSNAVLRRPADLFPLRFGNDSFVPHRAAALATGKPCIVLELPGIALDVDGAAELALLLRRKPVTRTQRLLREWRVGRSWKTPLSRLEQRRRARPAKPGI